MSLDDELRSAFAHEADTRIAPPPNPDGMIRGGRVRRRRRDVARACTGAIAVVLVASGGYAVWPLTSADAPGVTARPPASTAPTAPAPPSSDRSPLAPGTHRMFVGRGAAGGRIGAAFTVEGDNWVGGGDFPLLSDWSGPAFAGIGVYQPTALAAGRGCVEEATTTDLGRSSSDLAEQLTRLPRSAVLQAPAPAQVLGRAGVHLRLRVDVDCTTYYRVAETRGGHRGVTYTPTGLPVQDVVIDFWVLDVAGSRVVVDQWRTVNASDALVQQAHEARESIRLVAEE